MARLGNASYSSGILSGADARRSDTTISETLCREMVVYPWGFRSLDFVVRKNAWMGVRVVFARHTEAGRIDFGLHCYVSFLIEWIVSLLVVIPNALGFLRRLHLPNTVVSVLGTLPWMLPSYVGRILLFLPQVLWVLPWILFFVLLLALTPLFLLLVILEMLFFVGSPSFKAMRDEVKLFIESTPEFRQSP